MNDKDIQYIVDKYKPDVIALKNTFTVRGPERKKILSELQTLKTKLGMKEFPKVWEKKVKMIEDNYFNERFQLDEDSKEYKDIEKQYQKTSGKGTIKRIERI